MITKINPFVTLRVMLVVWLTLTTTSRAQNISPLSGHDIKIEDAVKSSVAIFTGQIENLEIPDIMEAGVQSFRDTKVKVIIILKGSVASEVIVTIRAMKIYKQGWESPPQIASSYIFFVKKDNRGGYDNIKLLEPTASNIAQVKALISSTPDSR
jgi:hypothetical protein